MNPIPQRRLFLSAIAATVAGGTALAARAAAKIKPGPSAALIAVDVQNCFVTGGTLPVARARRWCQ